MTDPATRRAPNPLHWTALIAPYGAVSGFVGVTINFLGSERGISVEQTAALVAFAASPHVFKFAWAPVADSTWSRRRWYLASTVVCALGILGISTIPISPENLRLLGIVGFVTNIAATTLGMAVEGLMTHHVPPASRGRAGGWFQAGNLGGNGLAGGVGLLLMKALPEPWMTGAILAGLMVACGCVAFFLTDAEAERREGGVLASMWGAVVELFRTVTQRDGALAALICFLPVGTGAAAGVLGQAEIAALWGAGEKEVAIVAGGLSGALAAIGCLVGGEICGRMSSRTAYVAIGALMAAVAGAMALAPATVAVYVVGNLAYSFVTGLAYAAFTGLVLEVIGHSSAATKYNGFASLSNTPIQYMGVALGVIAGRSGAVPMLWAEAGIGVAAIVFFLLVVAWAERRRA